MRKGEEFGRKSGKAWSYTPDALDFSEYTYKMLSEGQLVFPDGIGAMYNLDGRRVRVAFRKR